MLITEWNTVEAKEVWFEEGREEAARNALTEGVPIELVSKITMLDIEKVRELSLAVSS